MGIVIILVIAIILLGLVFKVIKLALIVAIVVGIAVFAKNKLTGGGGGNTRLK